MIAELQSRIFYWPIGIIVNPAKGEQAIEYVLSWGVNPNHIFLDINMPGMDGVQCLQELKKRNKIQPFKVTMYTTAKKETPESQQCIKLGTAFVTKPTSLDGIVHLIKTRLVEDESIL